MKPDTFLQLTCCLLGLVFQPGYFCLIKTAATSCQPSHSLTRLSCGSLVEDLDGPPDVQVEQSHGGCPLPLALLLQGPEEDLHVQVVAAVDPAAEPQGKAALLADVPQHIGLPVRTAPAAPALRGA